MTKKIIFTLTLLAIFLLSAHATIAAVDPTSMGIIKRLTNTGDTLGYGSVDTNSLPHAIGQIIQIFLSLLGIIFMTYIIYAGYLWMTARGEEEKINKAKAIIRGCIIGLIITMSAYIITATVIDRFYPLITVTQ